MRRRALIAAATLLGLIGILIGTAGAATAAPAAPAAAADSTGSVTSKTLALPAPYTGTFTPTGFADSAGQLVTTGTANVTNTVTGESAAQTVTVPVTALATDGGCGILNLTLGPLHLDLLGLVVDLNQVHLTITGDPGSGNLLGNLLCGVAGLLDVPSLVSVLVGILNGVLGLV